MLRLTGLFSAFRLPSYKKGTSQYSTVPAAQRKDMEMTELAEHKMVYSSTHAFIQKMKNCYD